MSSYDDWKTTEPVERPPLDLCRGCSTPTPVEVLRDLDGYCVKCDHLLADMVGEPEPKEEE